MAGKSPINVLSEYFLKKKCEPVYKEITVQNGTHINSFKCIVECCDYIGEGAGLTKKEAKRLAAEDMISKIEELSSENIISANNTLSTNRTPTNKFPDIINFSQKITEANKPKVFNSYINLLLVSFK